MIRRPLTLALLAILATAGSWAATLEVEAPASRAPHAVSADTEAAMRHLTRVGHDLSQRSLALRGFDGDFTLPGRVFLTRHGHRLPGELGAGLTRNPNSDLVLQFEASGARAFPVEYRNLLISTFNSARPVMNAVFGHPAAGGNVRVLNYDSDIEDRRAVAGGYVVPNAPGGPEIRFPIYNDPVSASINFVHTLLLAYYGQNDYGADAFNEGLVRAATMRVVRTPGALPGNPTTDQIENALRALYDVGEFYDWYNQPSLPARQFIAANLLSTPLPIGGSRGGIFLLRYQMAGSAWNKVLIEYPGAIAEFNRQFYAAPNLYQTEAALVTLLRDVLVTVSGNPNPTIEGLPVQAWALRQFILDTSTPTGLQVLAQPFPIAATAATADFGVFAIEINAFRTAPNGNELLLSGTTFPVFWRPDFVRFFTTAQDDAAPIGGGYGSVVPNFPRETFNGVPYRVAVDIPVLDQLSRVYLPAGAYSTGTQTTVRGVYGTAEGLPTTSGAQFTVRLSWSSGSLDSIPLVNGAFGAIINDPGFVNAQRVTVQVFQTAPGPASELFRREINKSRGRLYVHLTPPEAFVTRNRSLPARLSVLGFSQQPLRPRPASFLGLPSSQTLIARWNPALGRFALSGEAGSFNQGLGYFVRPATALDRTFEARRTINTPTSVALAPGWNMIANPLEVAIPLSQVQALSGTGQVLSYGAARGTLLGAQVFGFQPDNSAPDRGTLTSVTTLQPNTAYYFRALPAEGAVLLFSPPTGSAPAAPVASAPARGVSFGRGMPVMPGSVGMQSGLQQFFQFLEQQNALGDLMGAPPGPGSQGQNTQHDGWRTRIEILGAGSRAEAIIGQAPDARRGFDQRYDSELPPSPGGFQVRVLHPQGPLHTDIRQLGLREQYRILADGLVPGQPYGLRLSPELRSWRLTVIDETTGQQRVIVGSGRINFTAQSPQQTFLIEVGGQ